MRQHKWLDIVKEYDYEVLYHLRKANMGVDVLSHKATSAHIRDLCLRMRIVTPLLEQIREAHVEATNEEHQNSEWVVVWFPLSITITGVC